MATKEKTNGKAATAHWVGKKLKRKEDPRLIHGISHYTDDFKLAGMLCCASRVLRMPTPRLRPSAPMRPRLRASTRNQISI